MSPRPLALLALAALLAACASEPDSPPPEQKAHRQEAQAPSNAPLPSYMRELRGTLLGAPANSEVELALLLVDESDHPQDLIAVTRLNGTGQPLPFQLRFAPRGTMPGAQLELRGRVSQSGRLIMRLPARRISGMESQTLGTLRLVPAP